MTQRENRTSVHLDFPAIQCPADVKERVSRRAYELYEARGREDGHDVEDWLRAESELVHQQSKSLAA